MWHYGIALYKYWVTHSSYFILATTVVLGTGTPDGILLFCHRILEGSVEKTISTRKYNIRTVYDCFDNTFPYNWVIPDFNM